MKYTVEVSEYGDLEIQRDEPDTTVRLAIREGDDYEYVVMSLEEFRDFRKAVGYVWQEVHSDGE